MINSRDFVQSFKTAKDDFQKVQRKTLLIFFSVYFSNFFSSNVRLFRSYNIAEAWLYEFSFQRLIHHHHFAVNLLNSKPILNTAKPFSVVFLLLLLLFNAECLLVSCSLLDTGVLFCKVIESDVRSGMSGRGCYQFMRTFGRSKDNKDKVSVE